MIKLYWTWYRVEAVARALTCYRDTSPEGQDLLERYVFPTEPAPGFMITLEWYRDDAVTVRERLNHHYYVLDAMLPCARLGANGTPPYEDVVSDKTELMSAIRDINDALTIRKTTD